MKGTEKMQSLKAGGLLTQVNYSEKCTSGGLKGQSLKTAGIKDSRYLQLLVTVAV